jgi:hypothetical protein
MTAFPLVLFGMVLSVAVLIRTLIVVRMRAKLILGTIFIVLVILGLVLSTMPRGIVFALGISVIGIACLIYLLSQGCLFKMR